MRGVLPKRHELVVLAVLAVACAGWLVWFADSELALAGAAFPVILTAMLMGARRGGPLAAGTVRRKEEGVKGSDGVME